MTDNTDLRRKEAIIKGENLGLQINVLSDGTYRVRLAKNNRLLDEVQGLVCLECWLRGYEAHGDSDKTGTSLWMDNSFQ